MSVEKYREPRFGNAKVGRDLARISNQTTIEITAIEANAEIECTKVNAVGAIATTALMDVTRVTQIEQTLAMQAPAASGRLAMIADLAGIAMADIVANASRRIGR